MGFCGEARSEQEIRQKEAQQGQKRCDVDGYTTRCLLSADGRLQLLLGVSRWLSLALAKTCRGLKLLPQIRDGGFGISELGLKFFG